MADDHQTDPAEHHRPAVRGGTTTFLAPALSMGAIGVITPCSLTTATVGGRSIRLSSTGIRDTSRSATFMTASLAARKLWRIHGHYGQNVTR